MLDKFLSDTDSDLAPVDTKSPEIAQPGSVSLVDSREEVVATRDQLIVAGIGRGNLSRRGHA